MCESPTTLEYSRQPVRRPWWWRALFVLMLLLACICIISAVRPTSLVWANYRAHRVELSRGTIAYIQSRQGDYVNPMSMQKSIGTETGWSQPQPLHWERPDDRAIHFPYPIAYGRILRGGMRWTSQTTYGVSLVYPTIALAVILILTDRRSRRASAA
jgi:hypothetical protein